MNQKARLYLIGAKPKPRRLCDSCSSGVVMRSAGVEEYDVFCLFINCRVSPDVVNCNRYAERDATPGLADRLCESAFVS